MDGVRIVADDLSHPAVHDLLRAHRASALEHSPAESVHALDLGGLKAPGVDFWTMWDGDALVGMGALRALGDGHGEVKSMRVAAAYQRRGLGRAMLDHLIAEARARGWSRLSLETGSMAAFAPARAMYEAAGFTACPPFADYWDDPLSRCYTLAL